MAGLRRNFVRGRGFDLAQAVFAGTALNPAVGVQLSMTGDGDPASGVPVVA
jgi:hypothetical protein